MSRKELAKNRRNANKAANTTAMMMNSAPAMASSLGVGNLEEDCRAARSRGFPLFRNNVKPGDCRQAKKPTKSQQEQGTFFFGD